MVSCRGNSIASDELHAVAWAAKKAGESYGTFARRLTPEQRANVLEAYRAMVKDRNEAEKERLERAAERKQNEKQKQKMDPLWEIV